MQSIGERLEEARKRRGISIREASEATKIRGDFLLNFENNQFDVNLPDIYVRGFLRNYSGFLKIDPEKIVTDYNATLIGETKPSRRDSRELFGRLELPEKPRPATSNNEPAGSPTAPRHRHEEPVDTAPRPPRTPAMAAGNPELTNYVKIGLIIVGGIVALLVIIWLILGIINSRPSSPAATVTPPAVENNVPSSTITLIAVGDVWVKVTQVNDNQILFDGRLARGESKDVPRRGVVRVAYSQGSNLQVRKAGQTFGMTTEGLGQSTIP